MRTATYRSDCGWCPSPRCSHCPASAEVIVAVGIGAFELRPRLQSARGRGCLHCANVIRGLRSLALAMKQTEIYRHSLLHHHLASWAAYILGLRTQYMVRQSVEKSGPAALNDPSPRVSRKPSRSSSRAYSGGAFLPPPSPRWGASAFWCRGWAYGKSPYRNRLARLARSVRFI